VGGCWAWVSQAKGDGVAAAEEREVNTARCRAVWNARCENTSLHPGGRAQPSCPSANCDNAVERIAIGALVLGALGVQIVMRGKERIGDPRQVQLLFRRITPAMEDQVGIAAMFTRHQGRASTSHCRRKLALQTEPLAT
jgi:hypothetical protein